MPGQAGGPFFPPRHGHAATSLQAVAITGECPAHAGFNGALCTRRRGQLPQFLSRKVWEEMWSTTQAGGYCREIISTSSSPAPWPLYLSPHLQSCSWPVPRSLQVAIPQEQGRLKYRCQTCADVPRVAESQHIAVNFGFCGGVGWGGDGGLAGGSSALAGAVRVWMPAVLDPYRSLPAQSLTGWRYRRSRVYSWDPAGDRDRWCLGMAEGGHRLTPHCIIQDPSANASAVAESARAPRAPLRRPSHYEVGTELI